MRLRAYGLEVHLQVALPGVPEDTPRREPDLRVRLGDPETAWSGATERRVERRVDGRPFVIERGRAGDVLMTWGEEGRFHLDPALGLVRAWAREQDARWRRVLLDSVLGTAMLTLGGHALHGGAVVLGGGAVVVAGPSGAGKTSLVLALRALGHELLADDIVALQARPQGGFLAHPAPPVMNVPLTAATRERLATLDDEAWVAVAAAREPVPLRAVVLLARGAAAEAALVPLPDPAVPLLSVLFGTGMDPERMQRHFDLAAQLAEQVPLRRLVAPLSMAPSQLAHRLVASVADLESPDAT